MMKRNPRQQWLRGGEFENTEMKLFETNLIKIVDTNQLYYNRCAQF